MPVMLERWNDDRMDALDAKVDGINERTSELRHETNELRHETRELRHEMVELRKDMTSEFLRMHRLLIEVGFGIVLTLLTASHFL